MESNQDIEECLAMLRIHGASKIDTIKALRAFPSISLSEAKSIVHSSPVWQDVKERDEAFHHTFRAFQR
ncbi:hypothetical protein DTL21_18545 [Bremerella cremea]|uniref:Uncharacterized protein n=1 Tax=Blastopirellula marina TaxID=124 RepID=A0A2S8FJ57_9BACT|nr:hypothetical protein C5Y83_18530 [Blastopirellula marina]RCS45295.1 hypothetical protein DTL21_18545 [Bremerella cremea]